jgi:N-acetylglucosaminyldiphosphoundecaprenol N-acetyl-beta-D-mannosaminyltransferase
VITTQQEPSFAAALSNADLALPDGMPVAWMLRHLGFPVQQRINGPDFTWEFCKLAAQSGISVYFYGGTEETLAKLNYALTTAFPSLQIAGTVSPPFRVLSEQEQQQAILDINESGAGAVFVGLGCPKQELWMNKYKASIRAVTLGVGAAFDYHAGTIRRDPLWMQRTGLEWLARLLSEPRRLWRRYLVTITLFVLGATAQLLRKNK